MKHEPSPPHRHANRAAEPTSPETLTRATVERALRVGSWLARCDDGATLVVRRAASCLLEPRAGDRVLVAASAECFVLAVLDRSAKSPAELVVDGDAMLRTRHGRLDLVGDHGMRLTTPRTLRVVAQTIAAHADEAGIVARTVQSVADHVTARAKRVFRFITELDQNRSRQIDYRAESTARLSGQSTVVTAHELVKVDGEQVHIG